MPFMPAGRLVLCAIAAVLVAAGPASAEGRSDDGSRYDRPVPRHAAARSLPPETRYRDPRYRPPRRRAAGFRQPDFLIQAYLPRNTELPMYNEPPSRFPQR